ncbi:hypothetical protein [Pedobacter endophyticus]|uniref:Uncharacterized protein n=1 Tax=Pedobacter endophyticus TaxID=2789740 RepID=A0A7U3Q3J7_9SPHI|nr:hypothetical protein [Pedobacter endophyticus]QPH37857.1 hypothetical protein IZT61_12120 [Pedobacter endophyticus]
MSDTLQPEIDNNFKFLAIIPLGECDERYRKNLKTDTIYQFYNQYRFTYQKTPGEDKSKSIIRVDVKDDALDNLYHTYTADGKPLRINVSAVVGKNGSGKSTLIELLFAAVYIFSSNLEILTTLPKIEQETDDMKIKLTSRIRENQKLSQAEGYDLQLKKAMRIKGYGKKILALKKANRHQSEILEKGENDALYFGRKLIELEDEKKELLAMQSGLCVEIIYQINNQIFMLVINKAQVHLSLIQSNLKKTDQDLNPAILSNLDYRQKLAEAFFYTISINYSHYSLNSQIMGDWINALFHKNDGYKTPLVINPMRTDGDFKINDEISRAKYRLLCNLMVQQFVSKEDNVFLTDKQYVSKIRFTLNKDKLGREAVTRSAKKTTATPDLDIITNNVFAKMSLHNLIILNENSHPFQTEMDRYVVKKVKRIEQQYDEYKRVGKLDNFGNELGFKDVTEDLLNEGSHVAFKLKQVVNFFDRSLADTEENKFRVRNDLEHYDFTLEELVKWTGNDEPVKMIEFLPPAFFDIEIFLTDSDGGKESRFSRLSSGEQQLIHASQSMIYHINNINSVSESQFDRVKYRYINIIYDEIELYFHPEYQRRFISNLLNSFKSLHLGQKSQIRAINFLFLTHSPFIISDIPSSNILFLESNASPASGTHKFKTFGANIHDLLQLSFFLNKGSMGEYAQQKINQTIDFINYHRLQKEIILFGKKLNKHEKALKAAKQEQLSELKQPFNQSIDYHRALIDAIDEPLLKSKLQEMLGEVDKEYRLNELNAKIASLQKEKSKLKKNARIATT